MNISDLFKSICDAIREKEGSSGVIKHVDIPERILALSGSGAGESPIVEKGEFCLNENSIEKTIELSKSNYKVFICFTRNKTVNGSLLWLYTPNIKIGLYTNTGNTAGTGNNSLINIVDNVVTLKAINSSYPIAAGVTYEWYTIK